MKKPKVKLDAAAIQSFFVHHVEKIVLVVVLGVMAWLVYAGYSLPGLESGKTPSGLKQVSNQTRTFIDDAQRWERDVAMERQVDSNIVDLVGVTLLDTEPAKYFLPQPLSPPNFPKLSPRLDPTLYPPIHIEVEPIVGPLASYPRSMDELDPLYQEPTEDSATAKKPVRRPPPRRTAGSGMEDPYASGGIPGTDGRSGSGRSRRGSGRGGRGGSGGSSGYGPPAGGGSDMASTMADMMSSGSGSGMGMGMGSATGSLAGINPESILGYQTSDQFTIARHTQAMVIKAVVPFEKQAEEFLNSLGSSLDYEAQRDQPFYLGFFVERAEVPVADLEADPAGLAWTKINVLATSYEQLGRQVGNTVVPGNWSGVLNEIVDPTYLDAKLTHPAPPFMQRDVWRLLTHAEVPLASQMASPGMNDGIIFPGAAPKEGAAGAEATDDLPVMPGVNVGGSGFSGSDSATPGFGSGMPGGGMPGMPGGMSSGMGMPGGGMSRPSSMPFAGGMGSSGGSGMGGGYGSGYGDGYGSGATIAPPKYKLVRFTDTNVEPGKFYRYRLKVLLHDPNHPMAGMVAPTLASLDEKVRQRVKALDAADAAKPKQASGLPYRTFWIESDWSEASPVASLPATKQYFVGTVEQPAMVAVVDGKPKVPNSQPKAKVLTSVFDPDKVVDVPAEADVFRGSILNFVQDAQVIHPVTHEIVDLEKYNFRTDAIVADLEGGELIPAIDRKNDKPLKAPGELLIFDASGNLHVQNETDDIENYRVLLLPKPDPNAAPVGPEGMMMGPDGAAGMPEGFEGLMSAPGAGGGVPARGAKGRTRGGSGGGRGMP